MLATAAIAGLDFVRDDQATTLAHLGAQPVQVFRRGDQRPVRIPYQVDHYRGRAVTALFEAIGRLQTTMREPPALLGQLQTEIHGLQTLLGETRSELLAKPAAPVERQSATVQTGAAASAPGGANGNIHTAIVLPDGKILIGGAFTGINFDNKPYLARLNPDGSLDSGFAPVLNAPVLGLRRQADGKILIGGAMSAVNGALRPGIARINPDGSLDLAFDVGSGTNSTVWSIDLQNDKIVRLVA